MNDKKDNSAAENIYSDDRWKMLEMMCTNLNGACHKLLATRFMLEQTSADPVSTALYRKQVNAHNEAIADLQIMFKTFIVTSSSTETGHLPSPEMIKINLTKQRYGRNI